MPRPDPSIEEEWVIGPGRVFGHCHAGSMRQAVAGAHHKIFKCVARVDRAVGDAGAIHFRADGISSMARHSRFIFAVSVIFMPDDEAQPSADGP